MKRAIRRFWCWVLSEPYHDHEWKRWESYTFAMTEMQRRECAACGLIQIRSVGYANWGRQDELDRKADRAERTP